MIDGTHFVEARFKTRLVSNRKRKMDRVSPNVLCEGGRVEAAVTSEDLDSLEAQLTGSIALVAACKEAAEAYVASLGRGYAIAHFRMHEWTR